MKFRFLIRNWLAGHPLLDGLFRKHVWSRLHFPEMEMVFLNRLDHHSIDIAIDVGAALGNYGWIFERKSKDVFLFEPGEKHSAYLERLVGGKTHLVRMAVGSRPDEVEMFTPGVDKNALHSATLSKLNPVSDTVGGVSRKVQQTSLDAYFCNELTKGRRVDVLKIDVEGYENEVLAGGRTLIRENLPLIICEIEARHNSQYRESFQMLREMGYVSYVFRSGRFEAFTDDAIEPMQSQDALRLRQAEGHDIRENDYINNFVFQHPQTCVQIV